MDREKIFNTLKNTLNSYYVLSDTTWNEIKQICTIKELKKNENAYNFNENVDYISYVYKGLFRTYCLNENAQEYTKNFFWETRIYGPIVSLLSNTRTTSCVQALENSIVININHTKYRHLLQKYEDLKMYHILYLEKHRILQKDDTNSALVLEDAKDRYEMFLEEFNHIKHRISQQHIASYLGISPTHLSRIKKEMKN